MGVDISCYDVRSERVQVVESVGDVFCVCFFFILGCGYMKFIESACSALFASQKYNYHHLAIVGEDIIKLIEQYMNYVDSKYDFSHRRISREKVELFSFNSFSILT